MLSIFLTALLFIQFVVPFISKPVHAASLTETAIRLNRMGAAVAASSTDPILVVIKPATVGSIAKVKITWPTTNAFTVNSTAANHTATTTGIPSTFQGETLSAPTVTSPASNVTGGDVTFDVTGMSSASTLYGFFITGGITNPAAGDAGTHTLTVSTLASGGTVIDSQTIAVDTVGTNGDQVTVTASVPTSFNFNINTATIALGPQSVNSVDTGSTTIDVDTNANNGWAAWMRSEGLTATLTSASVGDTIGSTGTVNGSVETVNAGTENYVVDVSVAPGTGSTGVRTLAGEYDGNGTTTGGTLSTSYQEILYSTGQADSDTITLTVITAISGVTEAATDYTDTLEIIGAANF